MPIAKNHFSTSLRLTSAKNAHKNIFDYKHLILIGIIEYIQTQSPNSSKLIDSLHIRAKDMLLFY